MAIDTAQKRYSAMNIMCPWRHAAVIPTGTIDEAERLAARWLYSGILAAGGIVLDYVHDLNTRLMVFLRAFYSISGGDLTTLAQRWMREEGTGEFTARFRQLIAAATDAMT